MGFWLTFWLWTATFVLGDYFRRRLPEVSPAGLGDFRIPTATEGRFIPLAFGSMQLSGPNVVWYGDYEAIPRTVETGVIFKRDETIGYTYSLGLQLGLCRGESAGITGIWIGDDKVWDADEHNAGAPSLLVDINRPDLFGGEDEGGGFVGRIRLFRGTSDQAVSSYLAGHVDLLPAYRPFCYAVVTNLTEDGGAIIGESNTVRDIRVELQMFDTVANGGLGDSLGLGNDHHIIGKGINPIALAWDVWTNTEWGRAFSAADLDRASFQAAAETVWSEGLALSYLVDTPMDSGDLLQLIQQHVDGYIGPNPETGLIDVILARDDYTPATEFQAEAGVNLLGVSDFSRGDHGETFNEVRVRYSDRDKSWDETFAPAQDLAGLQVQGRRNGQTLTFDTVHEASVASSIAWRELKALSFPLERGTVEVDRTGYKLRPGRILVLTDPDVGADALPMRITRISRGDPLRHAIRCEVVEDVFGVETRGFSDPPASDFVPPSQDVQALDAADQRALEAPFIINRQDEEAPDTFPRLYTMARLSGGSAIDYEVLRRTRTPPAGFSGSYTSTGVVRGGFCVVGTLRSAAGAWQAGNGSLTLQVDPVAGSLEELVGDYAPGDVGRLAGVAVIEPGTAEEEWLAFDEVATDGAGVELRGLYRGCLDAAMHPHSAGARVWFIWTGGQGLPLEVFTPGDGIEAKFLPRSQTETLDEAEAAALTEVSLLDASRYVRPLLPHTLELNGTAFPAGPVSADEAHSSPSSFTGIRGQAFHRYWRTVHVLWSVEGKAPDGSALTNAHVTGEQMRFSWWLYDLDTTPNPSRVDAIVSDTAVALATPSDDFAIPRADLISAGITTNFAARLELEVEHDPSGEGVGFQASREPLFFDFDVTGTWA